MKFKLNKNQITWIGRLMMLLSLFFLFGRIYGWKDTILSTPLPLQLCLWMIGLTALYSFGYLLLSLSWSVLLKGLSSAPPSKPITLIEVCSIYARTQIAKYLPGNVFHFAGRHYLFFKNGFTHKTLFLSMLLENGGLVLAGLIVGFPPVIVSILLIVPIQHIPLIKNYLGTLPRPLWETFCLAELGYLAFMIIASCSYYFILLQMDNTGASFSVFQITSVYSLAMIAGLIIPGASGGLGIREAALYFLLRGIVPESLILTSSILFRLVTTAGDGLTFMIGKILEDRKAHEQNA